MIDEKLNQLLEQAEAQHLHIPKHLLVVNAEQQSMTSYLSEEPVHHYPISTSKYGLGETDGSMHTPRGLHTVADRIGQDVLVGTRFSSRMPIGAVQGNWQSDEEDDAILSRILRLRGLTLGYNCGPGIDSYERMIYIHGTNQEQLLGIPASHGCIRMGNHAVIELFDWLAEQAALCWIS